MARPRLRDLGITIGRLPTGTYNAITDVPGVLVGQRTVIYDEPRVARTGVTVIVPRDGDIWSDQTFAGVFSLNGCGEMTGSIWIEESGLLHTPIGITNTNAIGVVRDAIAAYPAEHSATNGTASASWDGSLPVAAETWDGWLSDIFGFHVTKEHVFEALAAAKSGSVAEGCVGGGTGMICHEFKGGIGTSSRLVDYTHARYTIGALVQANYGQRYSFRVDGVPVGREIDYSVVPARQDPPQASSIIVIIATDAPLLPIQCQRLAKRAAIGLARVGGNANNGSGDIFLAFATGNHVPIHSQGLLSLTMLPHDQMDPLFEATADAVEEAILNALTAAETMTGWQGRTAYALPLDHLQRIMARYRPHT
ncbi:MAG TPA: P1 family peptidase [Ktedonosporobacter sp.]|nr:P1 family peptidase [Ktedonosporobacter sp.]